MTLASRCASAAAGCLGLCALVMVTGWITWQLLPEPSAVAASVLRTSGQPAITCQGDCPATAQATPASGS